MYYIYIGGTMGEHGVIYMIRNKINNKKYIGQTRCGIKIRLKQHIKDSRKKDNCPIHRAIKKYGIENFDVTIICSTDFAHLNELEQYYIKKYRTFFKDGGYNLTFGGDGSAGSGACSKPILQYTLSGELIKEWPSIKTAAESLKLSRGNISNCCNGVKFKQVGGFVWRYRIEGFDNKIDIDLSFNTLCEPVSVCKYSIEGDFIEEYPSASIAAKENALSVTTVLNSCKKINRLPKRFIWRYKWDCLDKQDVPKYEKNIPSRSNIEKLRKAVSKVTQQYSLDGQLVREYPSAVTAASEVGLHYDSIYKACRGKFKTAGGFIWKYKEEI